MKKVLFIILFVLISCVLGIAREQYPIQLLKEVSYSQAQEYPLKWQISTYRYSDGSRKITRYFLPTTNKIEHDSEIVITKSPSATYPWEVRVNGVPYYASIRNDDEIKVGDRGVLKYEGSYLYFVKE